MSSDLSCPKCNNTILIKSGVIGGRQRYKCKNCAYYFSVHKIGKQIDDYYITKALQLYLEGLSAREIERLIGISHASVHNWVKKLGIKRFENKSHHLTYKVFNYNELVEFISIKENLNGFGAILTEVGDKYMMIRWERFRT